MLEEGSLKRLFAMEVLGNSLVLFLHEIESYVKLSEVLEVTVIQFSCWFVVKHSSLRSAFCYEDLGRLCYNSCCICWKLALLSLVGADFVKTTLFLVLCFWFDVLFEHKPSILLRRLCCQ